MDAADLDLELWREQGFIRLGRVVAPAEVETLRAEEARFRLDLGYGARDNQTLRVNVQLCHRSEALAFTGLTLHGSGPNHSSADRPALFVRYCEPGATMDGPEPGTRRAVLEDPHSWMVAGEA